MPDIGLDAHEWPTADEHPKLNRRPRRWLAVDAADGWRRVRPIARHGSPFWLRAVHRTAGSTFWTGTAEARSKDIRLPQDDPPGRREFRHAKQRMEHKRA